MNISNDIALLAPVPLEHLQSGKIVAHNEGKVAFGSNAFETFLELDKMRDGLNVKVYIYASQADPTLQVSWQAIYLGQVESVSGSHPRGMRYRPNSTSKYATDNFGNWGVFWELTELEEIEPENRFWINELQSLKANQHFAKNFVPKGPILVLSR